jgi:hypothetical protein
MLQQSTNHMAQKQTFHCHTNSFILFKGRDKTTTSHQTTKHNHNQDTTVLQREPIKYTLPTLSQQQLLHATSILNFLFDNVVIVCLPAVWANFYTTIGILSPLSSNNQGQKTTISHTTTVQW